ncbi:MAG: hypothetical protein Q8P67_06650 [archaeon]|nr:hypothetical protein [archaeon]
MVVFLWAPISGNYIGPSLFLTLGYIVPEVLPCWIALLIALGYGKNPDAIDFVQTLYGDERLLSSRERAPRSASPSAPPLHHRRKLKINNDSESEGALVSGDSVQDAYGYRSNDDDPPSELSRASSPEGFFPAEPFIDTLPLMLDSSSSYQSPPPSSLHYHSDLSNALGGYRYESLHHAPDLRSYGSVGTASSLLPPPPSSFSAATVSDSHAPRPGSLLERLSSQMKQYHA